MQASYKLPVEVVHGYYVDSIIYVYIFIYTYIRALRVLSIGLPLIIASVIVQRRLSNPHHQHPPSISVASLTAHPLASFDYMASILSERQKDELYVPVSPLIATRS